MPGRSLEPADALIASEDDLFEASVDIFGSTMNYGSRNVGADQRVLQRITCKTILGLAAHGP
eukprot:2054542-Karenia_brevis.AAC.1